MYNFHLTDTAHAIVKGRVSIIAVLKTLGLSIADDADEESVFHLVLENQENEIVQKELARILKKNPYHRHCIHCFDAIQEVYEKGRTIKKSMKEKLSNNV